MAVVPNGTLFIPADPVSTLLSSVSTLEKTVSSDTKSASSAERANTPSSKLTPEGRKAYDLLIQGIKDHQSTVDIPYVSWEERNQFNHLFREEHPELFYAESIGMGTLRQYPDGTTGETVTINYNNQAEEAAKNFLSRAPENGSDYEKELYVHDKLVQETEYQSHSYSREEYGQAIRDCLLNHKTSAAGYACTMEYMLNQLGVECEIIFGKAGNESHVWNRVTLNGKKYLTDVAWDDPSGNQRVLSHCYFNLSQEQMDEDHSPDNPGEEKDCRYTDQSWYKKNNLYYTSVGDAESAINQQLQTHNVVQVQLPDKNMASQVRSDFMDGKITSQGRGSITSTANGVVVVYLVNSNTK